MFKTYMIYNMYSINMNNHFVGEAHILCIYLFQYILTFNLQLKELQISNIRKKNVFAGTTVNVIEEAADAKVGVLDV